MSTAGPRPESLTSDGKLRVVHQLGNVLGVAVLGHQLVLGNVVYQILHTLLVAGEGVVVVEAEHLHRAQLRPVVTEDAGPVNVRWELLTLEPSPSLLVVMPQLGATHCAGTEDIKLPLKSVK